MSEQRFLLYVLLTLAAIGPGLYGLHRIALWLEAHGYIYYRDSKGRGAGIANAAMELDKLVRPSVEHHIEAEEQIVADREHDGV